MFTHYFAAGVCVVIAVAAAMMLRGPVRWQTLGALVVAGLIWCVTWLPQLKAQLAFVADTADFWLADKTDWPLGSTIMRLLTSPYRTLVADLNPVSPGALFGGCVAMYLLALRLRKRSAGEALAVPVFWLTLVAGAFAPLLALDLARHTRHLDFMKYLLLANPALCVLLGSLVIGRRWLAPIVIAAGLLVAMQLTPLPPKPDFEPMVRFIRERASPQDLIIFSSANPQGGDGQPGYLYLAHGIPWPSHHIAIIAGPQSPEFVATLPRGVRWFYFGHTPAAVPTDWLPGTKVIEAGPVRETAIWEIAPTE